MFRDSGLGFYLFIPGAYLFFFLRYVAVGMSLLALTIQACRRELRSISVYSAHVPKHRLACGISKHRLAFRHATLLYAG